MQQQPSQQRSWKVFLKNIDFFSNILLCVIIVILGSLNIVSTQTILNCILAALAIQAASTLRNRKTNKAIEKKLDRLARMLPEETKVYAKQEEAYKFLEAYIRQRHVKEAILLQYSCSTAMPVLSALLDRGATVTVYMQDEKVSTTIGTQEQADRTVQRCKFLRGELGDILHLGKLKVRKYHVPGSVSGIKINFGTEQVLCMGWYTYEQVDDLNRNPAYSTDTTELSGHDRAAVITWKGTDEFEALHNTFSTLEKNYQKYAEDVILS